LQERRSNRRQTGYQPLVDLLMFVQLPARQVDQDRLRRAA
jgi:hypothetical protein